MQVFEELNRLNKQLDLNLDLMLFDKGEGSNQEEHMNMLAYRPIKVIEKRKLNEFLSKQKNHDDVALKLDFSKEIDIANAEIKELADMFRKITNDTTQLIGKLNQESPSNRFMIFIDNFDIFIKKLQKEGIFITENNNGADMIFRDIFKVEISEWQKLCRVFLLIDEESVSNFIGGDNALERRIER